MGLHLRLPLHSLRLALPSRQAGLFLLPSASRTLSLKEPISVYAIAEVVVRVERVVVAGIGEGFPEGTSGRGSRCLRPRSATSLGSSPPSLGGRYPVRYVFVRQHFSDTPNGTQGPLPGLSKRMRSYAVNVLDYT